MAHPSNFESDSSRKQVRLMLLSTPRATSVIFTKCLSMVPDSEMFLESYYFCDEASKILRSSGRLEEALADRLSKEEWWEVASSIANEDCCNDDIDVDLLSFPKLKAALENPDAEKRLVVCKTVAPGLEGNYQYLPDESSNYRYTFLIRHPIKVLMSFRRHLYDFATKIMMKDDKMVKPLEEFHCIKDNPQSAILPDHMFKELHDLWVYVRENLDPNPIIIDSDDLLSDPAGMLSKYCGILGIPFTDDLLRLEADPSVTDDWRLPLRPLRKFKLLSIPYHNALYSTELKPPRKLPSLDDVTDDVKEMLEDAMLHYDKLYKERILPDF